ncbi:hypothetical protein Q1695_007190 [Nippostrongylus brasiliensis]|nr:hypothetical protein Q1695_007190 [Nippostrongylus brasiliensis]
MRARVLAAALLSVSAVVFYFWISVISKAPPDIRSDNISPQKEVCQGFQSRLEQVRNATFNTAPFDRSHLLPPFINYDEQFHVMSTLLDAISCYITNSKEFNSGNRAISKTRKVTRLCRDQTIACNLTAALSAVKPPRRQIALIRHPIERFLSGFVDKCINAVRYNASLCFSCKSDMNCITHRLMKHLRKIYEKKEGITIMGRHFAPQSWFCRFNDTIDQSKIIKYRGGKQGAAYLATEFNRVFREAGVPENLRNEIHKEMLVGRTLHSTHGSEDRRKAERTLMGNITLLTEVVRLYYYDFVLFDYELPSMF